MSDLRINLDDTNFDQLLELGRSLIPTLAPDWTDHNTHDPGIMLIELLAWIAEAQIYSLSRTRRDERQAYARLVGVGPSGPRAAGGLVWPNINSGPDAQTQIPWVEGTVVQTDTPITPDYPNAPLFYTTHRIQLTSARLVGLYTRFADGTVHDWTRANAQDGATFKPFGATPAPGDQLVLQFQSPLVTNMADTDAFISIGVEIAKPEVVSEVTSDDNGAAPVDRLLLRVSVEDSAGERSVELSADTTGGLLRSGVLLLRVGPGTTPVDDEFAIKIRSVSGAFLRPPRVQRIAPNVLPVQQLEFVSEENGTFGTGMPDQMYQLQQPGLVFPIEPESFDVSIYEQDEWRQWSVASDLQACGPNDRRFVLDPAAGTLYFGNGVNGATPPVGAALSLNYQVSSGVRGNLPKGVSWGVKGVAGVFGANSEATSGGRNGRGLAELQAIARRRTHEARPYVTAGDLMETARSFADLGVTRAIEIMPGALAGHRVPGGRTLVAVGPHDPDADSADAAESAEWLEEIRARLAPHVPLGQRLTVIAPRYIDVRVTAKLLAGPNLDPDEVRRAAESRLRAELAIVAQRPGDSEWPFGRDITPLAVKGWLRNVDGVARVIEVRLFEAGRDTLDKPVQLGVISLPQLHLDPGDIVVERWSRGGTP